MTGCVCVFIAMMASLNGCFCPPLHVHQCVPACCFYVCNHALHSLLLCSPPPLPREIQGPRLHLLQSNICRLHDVDPIALEPNACKFAADKNALILNIGQDNRRGCPSVIPQTCVIIVLPRLTDTHWPVGRRAVFIAVGTGCFLPLNNKKIHKFNWVCQIKEVG